MRAIGFDHEGLAALPGVGVDITQGKVSLSQLRDFAAQAGEPKSISGKQELFENYLNHYILNFQ